MKAKTLIPLVIGLGVGFFVIKMGVDMVQKAKGEQENTVTVYVASKSIDAAAGLTEQMIAAKQVPASLVPPECFNDKKALIGRVTKMPIAMGVPVTRTMLAPPGATPGLTSQIPAGHRAVSVKVTEETAVAGFITPGSRVDVFVIDARPGQQGQMTSRLVLSNVEVGAVGQSLSTVGDGKKGTNVAKTVTLFLRPEEIQQLNTAGGGSRGGVRLALRGPGSESGESFFDMLLKKAMENKEKPVKVAKKKPKPKPEAPKTHVVELRRGQNVEHVMFDEHGNVQRMALNQNSAPNHTAPVYSQVSHPTGPTEQPVEDDYDPPMETIE